MSDNKFDNKLDFRNVKVSQFGGAQTDRMEFSELQSSKRVYGTNAILKDAYTNIIQSVDGSGNPLSVEYWQAVNSAKDKIQMSGDVAGNKAGTYFALQEYLTKKTHVFWYRVSGSGTAPGIGDVETVIDISTNDAAAVIAFATNVVVDSIEEFGSSHPSVLASYIEIEYFQFGDTDAVDVGTSGFITSRLIEGQSFKVGEVDLTYDVDNNPIYGGNVLKGLAYNIYTASFEVAPKNLTLQDNDGDSLDINPDGSLNTVVVKDFDNFEVTSRDSNDNITQVEYKMGAVLVRTVDIVYDGNGCLLSYTETDA